MVDQTYFNKCQINGTKFFLNRKLNLILADIRGNSCYVYKCISEDCKYQATQYCDGKVEENYDEENLEIITQREFEDIWRSTPEITEIDEERYKCPYCKS